MDRARVLQRLGKVRIKAHQRLGRMQVGLHLDRARVLRHLGRARVLQRLGKACQLLDLVELEQQEADFRLEMRPKVVEAVVGVVEPRGENLRGVETSQMQPVMSRYLNLLVPEAVLVWVQLYS